MVICAWVCAGGVTTRPDLTPVVALSEGSLCEEKGNGVETKLPAPVGNEGVIGFMLVSANHSLNLSVDF